MRWSQGVGTEIDWQAQKQATVGKQRRKSVERKRVPELPPEEPDADAEVDPNSEGGKRLVHRIGVIIDEVTKQHLRDIERLGDGERPAALVRRLLAQESKRLTAVEKAKRFAENQAKLEKAAADAGDEPNWSDD